MTCQLGMSCVGRSRMGRGHFVLHRQAVMVMLMKRRTQLIERQHQQKHPANDPPRDGLARHAAASVGGVGRGVHADEANLRADASVPAFPDGQATNRRGIGRLLDAAGSRPTAGIGRSLRRCELAVGIGSMLPSQLTLRWQSARRGHDTRGCGQFAALFRVPDADRPSARVRPAAQVGGRSRSSLRCRPAGHRGC